MILVTFTHEEAAGGGEKHATSINMFFLISFFFFIFLQTLKIRETGEQRCELTGGRQKQSRGSVPRFN